jgi:hypothetical protein
MMLLLCVFCEKDLVENWLGGRGEQLKKKLVLTVCFSWVSFQV